MKIAILHEMLIKYGWAEKVVQSLLKIFPDADLFTLIYDEKKIWNHFPKKSIFSVAKPSQRVYNLTKNQRYCLPFMAKAVESLDFSTYDVVIASSSWFAHWAITKPETKFIVYSHSPARYLWDWTNEYKKDIGFNKWIKLLILNNLFLKIRQWDFIASKRSDITIANSKNTKKRITKYHRKDSTIIYPPVEWERFKTKVKLENFKENYFVEENSYYIIISALTEFKKIEVAIKSFNKMQDKKLLIVWDWNYRDELEKMSESNNIVFLWSKYWKELVWLVQNSLWLIFPWEEDFWIVPVEAMFSGKPVFAYKAWGLLETNIKGKTWEFFDNPDWSDFIEKFEDFDEKISKWFYKEDQIVKNAEKFWSEIFEKKIKKLVQKS